MWVLDNRTAYAAERSWTRDKQGAHLWLVAVKATFDIGPAGKLTLADAQPPPALAPEFRGKPASSSLLVDSDLLYAKPTTEILAESCAHAPRGRPAPAVPVSLKVGEIEKTVIVHGTRVYYRGLSGLTTSAAHPFVTQPIEYEWAFGGSDLSHEDPARHRIDDRNPVGRGFAVDARQLENQVAHSLEYPTGDMAKVGPAGFGPIASFWSPRRQRAGTYDKRWEQGRKPLLPEDYDERFGLSAPDDQRPVKPLRGGEPVRFSNATPDGTLSFELPKIFLAFRSRFGPRAEEHRATLTTVHIATETRKLSMVWQSVLRVAAPEVEYLDTTSIREKRYLS